MSSAKNNESESNSQANGSVKQKRTGRPRTRFEKMVVVPTRCPTQIYTYLKAITPFRYRSLTEMFNDMLSRFLEEAPWDHGLMWRKPKTVMTVASEKTGRTGWEQVNISLEPELANKVSETAAQCGVSKACFCYTAMFWWVQYVFPPNKMMLKKPS